MAGANRHEVPQLANGGKRLKRDRLDFRLALQQAMRCDQAAVLAKSHLAELRPAGERTLRRLDDREILMMYLVVICVQLLREVNVVDAEVS